MRINHARRPRLGRASRLLATLAVLAVPLGAVVTLTTAQPAAAATCSGTGCNNTDPYATGCGSGDYVVHSAADRVYGGTLQLWYGPNCGTNWTRYDSPNTIQHYIWVVQQIYYNHNYYYTSSDEFGFKYAGWTWSDQIYSPAFPADACEQEYYLATKSWGPVVCTGQFSMPGATNI